MIEIYRHETDQLAEYAETLLRKKPPHEALRAWMTRLAQYAMTKTGLAQALRETVTAPVSPSNPAHAAIASAVDQLLRANDEAGFLRPGVTVEDFLLAIAGLWHIPNTADQKRRAARLIALVADGLQVGAPSHPH